MSEKNSFRSIAKANAIFGGVSFYNVLISLVQSKLVAILLGTVGYGMMGLFNSTLDLIASLTNCGLSTSAVRDISEANATEDIHKITRTHGILSTLVWFTGILGLLLTFILAPFLSEWTFGDKSYTYAFFILSVVLLIRQMGVKYAVVLQGMRKHKLLAKASVLGKTLSFIAVIPIYYFWGGSGVVPAIIVMSLITMLMQYSGFKKLGLKAEKLSIRQSISFGKSMITIGIMLSITGIMDMIVRYLLNAGIKHMGSLNEVGLFSSGFGMVTAYVGLVFSSISTDYFPRLTSVANDKEQYNDVINKQYQLMILILAPIVLALIEFMPFVIKILYTDEFLAASGMMKWMAFGMILRAFSWCEGFMFLARGDSKVYLILYIFNFIVQIIFYYFGYRWGKLLGIGIAFFLFYVYSVVSTSIVAYKLYGCKYNGLSNMLTIAAIITSALVLFMSYWDGYVKYIFMTLFLLGFSVYSIIKLKSMLDIKLSTILKRR